MKRFLLFAAPLIFILYYPCFADTVRLFYGPNGGSGDNFGFVQTGPGLYIAVLGGTPIDFFNSDPIAPGSTLFGGTDVFMDGGIAVLGGISHDLDLSIGSLSVSPVTLPTDGKNAIAFVTLSFSDVGITNDTFQQINISGSETGRITFYYSDGYYYAGNFTVAPEPTTFVLLGTGLAGIAWRKYRALNKAHA